MHVTADSAAGSHLTAAQTGDILVVEENGVVYTGRVTSQGTFDIRTTADGGSSFRY